MSVTESHFTTIATTIAVTPKEADADKPSVAIQAPRLLLERGNILRATAALAALTVVLALAYAFLAPSYSTVPIARRVSPPPAPVDIEDSKNGVEAARSPGRAQSGSTPTGKRTRVRLVYQGIALDLLGIAWSLLVAILAAAPTCLWRKAHDRLTSYLFLLAISGLGGVLWALYQVSFQWNFVAFEYAVSIAGVAVLFFVTALYPLPELRALARHLFPDLWTVFKGKSTWVAVAAFAIVLALQPQTTPAAPTRPTGKEFEAWFSAQPRVSVGVPVPSPAESVVVVKFNDFQCPPCKRAHEEYDPVIEMINRNSPGAVTFIELDYPLDRACNAGISSDLHPAACDAAVAVRLAKETKKSDELRAWLWANQPTLTASSVRTALQDIAGVSREDFEARYVELIESVKKDVELGRTLGVEGTPTFFVGGVRIPFVPAKDFENALMLEIKKQQGVGVTK